MPRAVRSSPPSCWSCGPGNSRSLILERFYRVHLSGAGGGDGAEDHSDQEGGAERDEDGRYGDGEGVVGEEAYGQGQGQSDNSADDSAGERDDDGFGQELQLDLAIGCAQGLADADFADARAHGGQHDVHDADAADGQGDGGDQHQDGGQDVGNGARHIQHFAQVLGVVDGIGTVAGAHDALDLFGGVGDLIHVAHREVNLFAVVGVAEVAGHGERNQDGLVGDLRLPEFADGFFEHPDDREWDAADLELASDSFVHAAVTQLGKGF